MFVTINHADRVYVSHPTRQLALVAARCVTRLGAYCTVWAAEDAVRFGQLTGLRDLGADCTDSGK